VLVDLGSGDGAGVIDMARVSTSTLCVGIDTDASAARTASVAAARPVRKGGLPNVLFLACDARSLPPPFVGRVDELRIVLPWGSLLRSVLTGDTSLVATIAGALRPGARLRVLTSLLPRDKANVGTDLETTALAAFADSLEDAGLLVTAQRAATSADLRAMRSSWARRLGVPERRPAQLLEAHRPSGLDSDGRRQPSTAIQRTDET
jgi:16S rRNA (adenine(1408)-N(1))-methyltransferase